MTSSRLISRKFDDSWRRADRGESRRISQSCRSCWARLNRKYCSADIQLSATPAYQPVQVGTGAGATGGALTAISAAKAGVTINPSAAIAVNTFFTVPPKHTKSYHTACRVRCYRFNTVKRKTRRERRRVPNRSCLHSISPKGLHGGETIRGEWGIWSPGGRPAGAASSLLAAQNGPFRFWF